MALSRVVANGLILLGLSTLAFATEPPASQPGRWHCATVLRLPKIAALDDKVIWFENLPSIWRYDVADGKVTVLGPLEGLPRLPGIVSLAPDGRLASSRILWGPNDGLAEFRTAPSMFSTSFGPDGRLVGWQVGGIHRWADDHWKPIGQFRNTSWIIALKKGYVALSADFMPKAWFVAEPAGQADLGQPGPDGKAQAFELEAKPLKMPEGLQRFRELSFRRGDGEEVFCWFGIEQPRPAAPLRPTTQPIRQRPEPIAVRPRPTTQPTKLDTYERAICKVSEAGIELKIKAHSCGPDLKAGGFVALNLYGVRGGPAQFCRIESTVDGDLGQFPVPPMQVLARLPGEPTWAVTELPMATVRDKTGQLWVGAARWTGKTWDLVVPKHSYPYRDITWVTDPEKLRFDPATGDWVAAHPEIPIETVGFDPKDRTGWLWQPPQPGPEWLVRVRFAEDGDAVPIDDKLGGRGATTRPSANAIRTSQGEWWWADDVRMNPHSAARRAYRLTPDGQKMTYPLLPGSGGNRSIQPGEVFCSPKGNIWIWHGDGYFARFDRKTVEFVKDEPWDEFAFRLGPLQLSAVCGPIRPEGLSAFAEVGLVYCKVGDKWRPLANPFTLAGAGMGIMGRPSSNSLYMHRGGSRGDRILLVCGLGTMEYDATNNRWALLHGDPMIAAFFDPAGRRVLVHADFDGYVLTYDGDPFGGALPEKPSASKEKIAELVAQMSDRDWKVREDAGAAARKLLLGDPATIMLFQAALGDAEHGDEAKVRIDSIIQDVRAGYGSAPRALFDQSHAPPKGLGERRATTRPAG